MHFIKLLLTVSLLTIIFVSIPTFQSSRNRYRSVRGRQRLSFLRNHRLSKTNNEIEKYEKLSEEDKKPRLVLLDDIPMQSSSNVSQDQHTPVVFWHGMADTSRGSIDINRIVLQRLFPGIKVFSIQVGSNEVIDRFNSIIGNVNEQISDVCDLLIKEPVIKQAGKLNLLGFSQGCQFLRGLVQRCPFKENNIHVSNLISLGGQHQGVFGLPNCDSSNHVCEYIRRALLVAYESRVQATVVQAQYWHDPTQESMYRRKSGFLADINNELQVNVTYKRRLLDLDNFVLVEFAQDTTVIPRETSSFGFYKTGQQTDIEPLEESKLFVEDRLGLKQMIEEKRLHMIKIDGNHLQYNMTWFTEAIAKVYLNK